MRALPRKTVDLHSDEGKTSRSMYVLAYALSSMRAYPLRAFSLLLTLSLATSMIGSIMIWSDTGIAVSINSYFDSRSFQMAIETSPGQTALINDAEEYVQSSPYVDHTLRLNSTVGLVFGTGLPNKTVYGLQMPVYSHEMKDCEVIFVNNMFLREVADEFDYEGSFELHTGEVLVSVQCARYIYEVFGIPVIINSTIDIEVLTRRGISVVNELSTLGRVSLRNLRVVGIYEVKNYNSIIAQTFPSRLRSNYDYVNFYYSVLGIYDSVMLLSSSIDVSKLPDVGFFGAQVYVRVSPASLIAGGSAKIAANLLALKTSVEAHYAVSVTGLEEILYLQTVINTYASSTYLALLNTPVFMLALFLAVSAAHSFMRSRRFEVSVLRSKGASSAQVYGVFTIEAAILFLASMLLGLLFSVLISALILSTNAFLVFDWSSYQSYLYNTVLKPETILYCFLLCILPSLLVILYFSRRAAATEIGVSLVDSQETVSRSDKSNLFAVVVSIVLFVMVLSMSLLLSNPLLVVYELVLGTIAWFFMAYNGSQFFRTIFANITSRLAFLLGEKGNIAAINLKMRRGHVVSLMVILSLSLSSTIAFAVQANSFHADLQREISYAIGADLRVSCTPRPFDFANTIEGYPGVNRAMPVLTTSAQNGLDAITLVGVNGVDYSEIGNFDALDLNGEDLTKLLIRLASVENGVLLSEYHARRWNKTIGDDVVLRVSGAISPVMMTFRLVGLIFSAPGLGCASTEDAKGITLSSSLGFQTRLSGFGIANIDYLSGHTGIETANLFFADLAFMTDHEYLVRSLAALPSVNAVTPETFDLKASSFQTAVFLSNVEGLLSIGFVMCFILTMFALTLFLGSIVHERVRDYAILRAVGFSRPQLTRVVMSEFVGVVVASLALSVVLGTLFGHLMSLILFTTSPFSRVLEPTIVFPIGPLTVILLIEMMAMIIGAYFPARDASLTDPAVVLRNL